MLIRLTPLVPGLLLIIGMLVTLPWKCLITLTFGLMEVGRTSLLLVGLRLLVLVFIHLLLMLLLILPFGSVAEEYVDARLERCRAFMPVPGVLQSVQRAEFWGAILALQAHRSCHLGIDSPSVLLGLLVGCWIGVVLLNLCRWLKVGIWSLLLSACSVLEGRDTVRVTKVKGHATDADVAQGRVRIEDKLGDAETATDADIGRRHQLHRFKIAVSRAMGWPLVSLLGLIFG